MTNADLPQKPVSLTVEQALQQAIAHHQAGRLQDAERLYRAILQAQPNHPDANHNLGVLAVQVKQPAAGLPHLKTALETNPNQGQCWLNYIDALIKAGQTDAARQVLKQGRQQGLSGEAIEVLSDRLDNLEHATPDQSPEIEAAITHREAGRYKEAALVLQSRLVSNPHNASAYALLAQVLFLDKQDKLAWAAINTALSINPTLPIVQRNYARLWLKKQKPSEALLAAQAAYQSDSADPENQLVLAAALAGNDQNKQAFPLVESALQSRPNYAEAFATRALLKLRGNDPAGALADAEQALSFKPHLGQLWGMVGSLRHQLKDQPGTIDALEKALDYEPDNVGHLVNLGEFKRQAGAVEDAVVLLEKAVAIAPENARAWVNLGTVLQESHRIPEAKAAYAKALEIAPEQAEVTSNLGALAKEEENWEEALRYFNQALVYQPTRVDIMTNRVAALNALERYDEAELAARHTIDLEPAHTEAHLALSSALIGQRHYEAAQAVIDTLALASPANMENTHRLALSYTALFRALNSWPEAEKWARRALAVKPKEVKVLRQLGAILGEQKRHGDAWAVFQEALEHAPQDADTLQSMANHHAMQEDWTEAENWVRRALAVKPKEVKILRQLGAILDEQKRHGDAWAVFQEALEHAPQDADTLQSMANHHAMQEDWTEAENWVRRALAVKPKEVKILRQLGAILDEQKRHGDAWAVLKEALTNSPEDVDTLQTIVSHYTKQENWPEAEAWVRRALTIRPDFPEAQSSLANILLILNKNEEAVQNFRKALDSQFDLQRDYNNLVRIQIGLSQALSRLVPSWHLPMMNDSLRNDAYFGALRSVVTVRTHVLEIGTGSGLLAMMAARLGAAQVVTCEAVPLIAAKAQEIVAANGLAHSIRVIAKKSSEIVVGVDMPHLADILVSEIFSSELLGEGVLPSIEDAKRRLLVPDACIIPAIASVVFALFGGTEIKDTIMVDEVYGFDLSKFNDIASQKQLVYRNDLDIELLTDDTEAFSFDFLKFDFFPTEVKFLRMPIKTAGRCYGVMQWIRLRMNDSITFENNPSLKNSASGWQQCLYRFPTPVDVSPGQTAIVCAAHNRKALWFFLEGLE